MAELQATPTQVVRTVLSEMLRDLSAVHRLELQVQAQCEQARETITDLGPAWAAHFAVAVALEHLAAGEEPYLSPAWVDRFAGATIAGRTVLALYHLCAYTEEETAILTSRSIAEVEELLAAQNGPDVATVEEGVSAPAEPEESPSPIPAAPLAPAAVLEPLPLAPPIPAPAAFVPPAAPIAPAPASFVPPAAPTAPPAVAAQHTTPILSAPIPPPVVRRDLPPAGAADTPPMQVVFRDASEQAPPARPPHQHLDQLRPPAASDLEASSPSLPSTASVEEPADRQPLALSKAVRPLQAAPSLLGSQSETLFSTILPIESQTDSAVSNRFTTPLFGDPTSQRVHSPGVPNPPAPAPSAAQVPPNPPAPAAAQIPPAPSALGPALIQRLPEFPPAPDTPPAESAVAARSLIPAGSALDPQVHLFPPPSAAPQERATTSEHSRGSTPAEEYPPLVKRRVRRLWRLAVGATGVLAIFATIAIVSTHNGNGSSNDLASAQGRPSATSSLASADGTANLSTGCKLPSAREPITRTEFSVKVGGSSRSALVQAPRALDSLDARAVLIDIPESFQDVDTHFAESDLVSFAEQRQLLLVTPTALPGLPWNPAAADGLGADFEYLDSLLTQLGEKYCVDLAEVHLVGFGTGAHLAAGFACKYPQAIRSLTMVAGIYRPSDCTSTASSITAVVNGADEVFPVSGGRGPGFASLPGDAQQSIDPGYEPVVASFVAQQYREGAACEGGTRTENEAGVAWTYGICPGGTQISFGVVDGAGHSWTPAATEVLRARLILSE